MVQGVLFCFRFFLFLWNKGQLDCISLTPHTENSWIKLCASHWHLTWSRDDLHLEFQSVSAAFVISLFSRNAKSLIIKLMFPRILNSTFQHHLLASIWTVVMSYFLSVPNTDAIYVSGLYPPVPETPWHVHRAAAENHLQQHRRHLQVSEAVPPRTRKEVQQGPATPQWNRLMLSPAGSGCT